MATKTETKGAGSDEHRKAKSFGRVIKVAGPRELAPLSKMFVDETHARLLAQWSSLLK